jgi:hypothetical protein
MISSSLLPFLPVPVPVPVPDNCQTVCNDRLKAGPLREDWPAPGFRRGRVGAGLPVPEWPEPFPVPLLLTKGPVSECLRAPKTPAPAKLFSATLCTLFFGNCGGPEVR